MKPLKGGPDAARYIAAAQGQPVPRPFHLRWLLPYFLGTSPAAWWTVHLASWVVAAAGMFAWRITAGDTVAVAVVAVALLLALPGILGPKAVIPVGVDLPATAVSLVGVWLVELGHPAQVVAGVATIAVAGAIKESAPAFAALWVWSPWPLLALVVVAVRSLVARTGPDPLGPRFDEIAAHPVRAALGAHEGMWRDAWVMVAPWGACLAGLIGSDWQLWLVLAVAYAQLVVATDSVRLYQHAAGPVMAAAAASAFPVRWLPLVVVVHAAWWRKPERV